MSEDPTSLISDNRTVLNTSSLIDKCPLSSKSDFWLELEAQHIVRDQVICLMVSDFSLLSKELSQHLKTLKPYTIDNPDDIRTLLRYSSEATESVLYKIEDINNIVDKNSKLWTEINELVNSGGLKLDKLAQILIVPETMTYFSKFDGVTLEDLKVFFNLDNRGAAWILNTLEHNGILKLETVQMMRLTSDSSKWETLVRSHLNKDAKPPQKNDSIELKLMYANAGYLQRIKNDTRLLNVSKEVIQSFCKLTQGTLDQFYDHLVKEKLLEPYLYNIWRQNSKLDCSSLPLSIADNIDEFLADRFAYSFALENICLSLEEANKDPMPTATQVFLPENPFREVSTDLVNSGLAMPSRICVSTETINDIDFDELENSETIKSVFYSNRFKLYDQTDYHMEMVPLSVYMQENGFLVDSDLNNIINNGLKMVIGRRRETTASLLLNDVISAFAFCWNKIKTAANAVTSFCYSVVKFTVQLPGLYFKEFEKGLKWLLIFFSPKIL